MLINNGLNKGLLKILIGMTLVVNAILMFFMFLPDHDPALYATIAKHMVLSDDWVNLVFNEVDWLDKPHLPFWITAISFKLLGLSSFSYIFPGFIFHLIGARYTYVLASHLLNRQVALIAVLFYVTAAHLMLSTLDVRAEVYLLGEIMPACYYWLRYHEEEKIKVQYLLLGAFFTALAMMTKGIFVLVTTFSGLGAIGLYRLFAHQEWSMLRAFSSLFKWVLALSISFLFITPELVSLYLQFDAHPEKWVFNQTHVSGIRWFFWDSQIGRFFNTGQITGHTHSFHYLFFVPVFLWSFLPWTMIYLVALYEGIASFRRPSAQIDGRQNKAFIYLLGAIFPTFFMFSLSSFQLDHYTNIILPFTAILAAAWVQDKACFEGKNFSLHWVFALQVVFALAVTGLVFALAIYVFAGLSKVLFLLMAGVLLCLKRFLGGTVMVKAIVYSTVAINISFIFFMGINREYYKQYDAGYTIAGVLNRSSALPVIEYQANLPTLAFHYQGQVTSVETMPGWASQSKPYYLITRKDNTQAIEQYVQDAPLILETSGIYFINNPYKMLVKSLFKPGLSAYTVPYLVFLHR